MKRINLCGQKKANDSKDIRNRSKHAKNKVLVMLILFCITPLSSVSGNITSSDDGGLLYLSA